MFFAIRFIVSFFVLFLFSTEVQAQTNPYELWKDHVLRAPGETVRSQYPKPSSMGRPLNQANASSGYSNYQPLTADNKPQTVVAPQPVQPMQQVYTTYKFEKTVTVQEVKTQPVANLMLQNSEIGIRYWYNSGRIDYDVEDPKISRLEYDDKNGHAGEVYGRFASQNHGFLIKGLLGFGSSPAGGSLDDEDYENGATASDTYSRIKESRLSYGQIDIGYRLKFLSNDTITTSLFGGYGYMNDVMVANGVRCNQISTGIYAGGCNAVGEVVIPFDTKAIKNKAQWDMARIGIENIIKPHNRVTLKTDMAIIPYAGFHDEDSHYLRVGLGSGQPNFVDDGTGYGVQLQAMLDFRISENLSLGVGGRYWRLWAPETKTKVGNPIVFGIGKSYNWEHERFGAMAEMKYSF